jgi:DNA-binding transcriptional regulator YhcF (GntR family)
MTDYLRIVKIDEYSITPKYRQVVNAVMQGIEDGKIVKDDLLPSINELCVYLDISRNSVEKAYATLKKAGIVSSIAGKGYFIKQDQIKQPVKILLLFNKLSAHKKMIYDAFAKALGTTAAIDFYIYNNDFNVFKKLITEKIDNYSRYVIIPHFLENEDRAHDVINLIPKEKLILLDKLVKRVSGSFSAVFEDFEKDIFGALEQLLERLSKYHSLKIIFPKDTYHSKEILQGFQRFCNEYAFEYETINFLKNENLVPGTVYISLMEDDLVELIEKIINSSMVAGIEIGVISYNETPLKRVILNGITTISTDFELMGRLAADLVFDPADKHIPVPFKVTVRNSL